MVMALRNAHLPDAQHIWSNVQIDQMCLTSLHNRRVQCSCPYTFVDVF